MNVGMRIVRAVANKLDSDVVYEQAQGLGQRAARGVKRSQISGLEGVANGSRKVSDVLDYIKLRTARHKEWREKDDIGAAILAALEKDLRRLRDDVCHELEKPPAGIEPVKVDDYMRQDIYLRLIRGFVAQIAAQYEFSLLQTGREEGE